MVKTLSRHKELTSTTSISSIVASTAHLQHHSIHRHHTIRHSQSSTPPLPSALLPHNSHTPSPQNEAHTPHPFPRCRHHGSPQRRRSAQRQCRALPRKTRLQPRKRLPLKNRGQGRHILRLLPAGAGNMGEQSCVPAEWRFWEGRVLRLWG
jgi:hypothetical protein